MFVMLPVFQYSFCIPYLRYKNANKIFANFVVRLLLLKCLHKNRFRETYDVQYALRPRINFQIVDAQCSLRQNRQLYISRLQAQLVIAKMSQLGVDETDQGKHNKFFSCTKLYAFKLLGGKSDSHKIQLVSQVVTNMAGHSYVVVLWVCREGVAKHGD